MIPQNFLTPALVATLVGAALTGTARADDTDIEHRLAQQKIDLRLESLPLEQAVHRIVSHFSLPVRVVWPEDLARGLDGISLQVEQQPIGDILRQVLRSRDLDFIVEDGDLKIIRARSRYCLERDAAQQRFLARGIRVEMIVAKPDRCDSRARIGAATLGEGSVVEEGVVVGLIRKSSVVFLFEGFLFELGEFGRPPPAEEEIGAEEPGAGTEEDRRAFEQLDLHVSGIYIHEDDADKTFAVISGADYYVGDALPVAGNCVVKEIKRNHIVVEFRGLDWPIYWRD